jgi:hypothetical protein
MTSSVSCCCSLERKGSESRPASAQKVIQRRHTLSFLSWLALVLSQGHLERLQRLNEKGGNFAGQGRDAETGRNQLWNA